MSASSGQKLHWPHIALGIGSYLIRLGYRLVAPLIIFAALFGAYKALTPLPAPASFDKLFDAYLVWASKNWVPLSLLLLVWNSVRTTFDVRGARRYASSALAASAAVVNYFNVDIETDEMRERRNVNNANAWDRLKAEIAVMLIFYIFDLNRKLDPGTALPTREGKRAQFTDDCLAALSARPNNDRGRPNAF